jgi:hypothetical protein
MTERTEDLTSSTGGEGGSFNEVDPRIVPARGGYLALTPGDIRPRIGVVARNEGEAREQFRLAMEECRIILARSGH